MLWMLSFRNRILGFETNDKRKVTAHLWEEFCDSIKAAGAVMLAPGAPCDGLNQVCEQNHYTNLKSVSTKL